MGIRNETPKPVLFVVYVGKKPGDVFMVMPGEREEVKRPTFLHTGGDEEVLVSIEREFIVTDQGRYDEVGGVLLIAPGKPSSIVWTEGGRTYGIRVRYFDD